MTELTFPSTAGFKKYEQLFDRDSVRHPAKMNLRILSWLIDHYSKKGDLILDPMAGTFSTCVIGALKGRNCVGVELEQKFVGMGLKNKALVRLDSDTIRLCESVGFRLKERHTFKLPQQSFWRIIYQKKYPSVPKIEHEDVLVFSKEAFLHT